MKALSKDWLQSTFNTEKTSEASALRVKIAGFSRGSAVLSQPAYTQGQRLRIVNKQYNVCSLRDLYQALTGPSQAAG